MRGAAGFFIIKCFAENLLENLKLEKNSENRLRISTATAMSLVAPVIKHPPWRGGALSDTAIRPSVCPPVCPSLGYRHAGCLQLAGQATRDVRTADPSADGRRSAASRTAVGGRGKYRCASAVKSCSVRAAIHRVK